MRSVRDAQAHRGEIFAPSRLSANKGRTLEAIRSQVHIHRHNNHGEMISMPSEISLPCTVGFSFAVASQILAKFATMIRLWSLQSDIGHFEVDFWNRVVKYKPALHGRETF